MTTPNNQNGRSNNNNRQRQNGGGGLLSRVSRQPANQNQGQQTNANANNNTANPNAAQQSNPFGSQNNTPPHTHLNWSTLPVGKVVVRFDLRGLGDPFYRLLGHEIDETYGDSAQVVSALEQGGGAVDELYDLLEETWGSFGLQGAALVFNWNDKVWKSIVRPNPMPVSDDDLSQGNPQNNNNSQKPEPPPPFVCLRAIDMDIVLNVLARARTQLILAGAPLIFSQQYLSRTLVSDDPRLVSLVRATGYLTEAL